MGQLLPLTRFSHYYLGHEVIDREHRIIYNALIKLWKTTPPDLNQCDIDYALKVCQDHFAHEDEAMIGTEYMWVKSHLEVHFAFEQRMKEVIMHPTKESLDELINEFLHHIDYYDRPFVEYLIGIQHGFKTEEYLSYLHQHTGC